MKTQIILLALAIMLTAFSANSFGIEPSKEAESSTANSISGKIIDAISGTPMEFVSVAVYKSSDSSLVKGTTSDSNGTFKFEKLPNGDYFIRTSFVGYQKKQVESIAINNTNKKSDLGQISMAPISTEVEGVVVTAEKNRVEYKIDKRVINVDKDISAKGGTAVNVLENTPSVQVDPQGNVTLRGSSDFIVLIDGKPSVLKGSDALKQLPASSIKQIEVITNPSAKYDADGQAGIINIVMKKEKLQGLNGNLNMAAGNTNKRTANLLVNYKTGKVNYFSGIDFADNEYNADLHINNMTVINAGKQFTRESANQFFKQNNFTFKGGLDYDINDKNSVSVSGSIGKQGYDHGSDASFHIWNELQTSNAFNTSSNYMDVTGNVIGLNADYSHKFADNHTFSFTNSYSSWSGYDDNLFYVMNANQNFSLTDLASKLNFRKDNYNYQYRNNLDYKRPLGSGTFEIGTQFRLEERHENLDFKNYNIAQANWSKNDTFSYIQDYLNTIYSGYLTYSGKILTVDYQIGLRSEYFHRSIDMNNGAEPLLYNKFMFYPSVHFSKNIKEKHQLQLSYSRRINRPQPWLLNDTRTYIDPYNIFMGNPYVKPEFTDAYEFNYRVTLKKITISAQSYLRNTSNLFSELRLMQDNGVMIHKLSNSRSQVAFGEELGLDLNVAKWWQINTGANIYHYTLKTLINNVERTNRVNTWDARFVNNFSLKWGTKIQTISYYRAPSMDAMGEASGFFTTNLAISQPVLKSKASLGISVENVFDSQKFVYSVQSSTFDNHYNIRSEGPVFRLNFSYSFNNFQHKNRGRADDTSFKDGGGF